MRVVVQRVSSAAVRVDGETVGAIGPGVVALAGVAGGDTERDAVVAAGKLTGLRIFPDDEGRMNRSVLDVGGAVLVVSQFTLVADVSRGRRPSFTRAAAPPQADRLVDRFVEEIEKAGVATRTGRFGSRMAVELVNDGPVTIVLDVVGGRVV